MHCVDDSPQASRSQLSFISGYGIMSPIWIWMLCLAQLCFIGTLGSGRGDDETNCKPGANIENISKCSKDDSSCNKQESRRRTTKCSAADKRPYGLLSPGCVAQYSRLYLTRRVPPRNYRYFHEILQGEQDAGGTHDAPLTPLSWRIVGGDAIDIISAPFMVLYGEYCGGSLIAPEWVITAAHCTSKEKFILAGSTLKSQATRYNICAHFIHPLWASGDKQHPHDWDYQLVLLEHPVPVTPMSRPIAIGSPSDIQPGLSVSVSGWGHVQHKKSRMQDQLRRVFVPIMSSEDCRREPNISYRNITSRMFCAGLQAGLKDSCQGDSGGPVVYQGKLIGLVSFGVGCAVANQPGVYTKIPYARDWIRSVTGLPL